MNLSRSLLPLFFALICGGPSLWSADAPTAEEWSPVEQALSEDAPSAGTKLAALITLYPRWAGGQRTMAGWHMRHGQPDAALLSAKQALAVNPRDSDSAAIAVQALGALHRPGEAFALADTFVGEKDPSGWVNFRAAEVALELNDPAKAELHLSLANGRVKVPPAEFSFLDARISVASGDLDRADISLTRAVAANPRLWNAWYELGVVQLRQAERKTASSRRDYLNNAETSFIKVTAVQTKDALSWLGLGRTQLTQAQDLLAEHSSDSRARAAKAVVSLRNAVEINPALRDAHLNLGVALLIDDQHDQAITHLLKARAQGSKERMLSFNLMLAYQKAGRSAEFEAEAKSIQAVSPAEKITAGIGFFRAGSFALAAQLLTSALPELGEDRERVASTYRFIAHAHAGLAAAESAVGGDGKASEENKERENQLDLAREAFKKAGNYRDFPAQHFYLAQETKRSPTAGYEAGWQFLTWQGYASIDGWSAVLGNYGGAMTGGEGVAGMWNRHPFHLIVWSVLAFFPLCFALFAWLRPRRVKYDSTSSVDQRPVSESMVKSTRPAVPIRPVATRPPAPAKVSRDDRRAPPLPSSAQNQSRTPAPATRSPAVIKPARPVSPKPPVRSPDETEASLPVLPAERVPRVADNHLRHKQAETEPSLRPAKAPEKKAPVAGEFAALERRTPRPEDGKKK
jgi:tetratricopeptide (TPR) repeat protein